MKIVHISIDENFEVKPIASVFGYCGCWFYKCPETLNDIDSLKKKWCRRWAHFFEIEEEYITLEQDFGCVQEYFVEAYNLDKLRRIEPELRYET